MNDTAAKILPQPPAPKPAVTPATPKPADEFGATDKPEPTRYGDWEIGGRCVDF